VGDNVKIFGGAMVGLQFAGVMENLGSLLNGVVNFQLPGFPNPACISTETKTFFDQPMRSAPVEAKVDPLAIIWRRSVSRWADDRAGRQCDQIARPETLAKYLRENTHQTIIGPIAYSADGEWKETATLEAQFRGIADKNVNQFRSFGQAGDPVPRSIETGDLIFPFEDARK